MRTIIPQQPPPSPLFSLLCRSFLRGCRLNAQVEWAEEASEHRVVDAQQRWAVANEHRVADVQQQWAAAHVPPILHPPPQELVFPAQQDVVSDVVIVIG
jgi:hypothetical protein